MSSTLRDKNPLDFSGRIRYMYTDLHNKNKNIVIISIACAQICFHNRNILFLNNE